MNFRKKYVPKTFADMVGAKAVTEALSLLALLPLQVAISLPYGMGKTTWAYLFVKFIFCNAAAAVRPCGICAECLWVDRNWGVGDGSVWVPGGELHSDWFRVVDFTKATPNQIKDLRDHIDYFNIMPKALVLDEFHSAVAPTQRLFLKLLEQDLTGSMIFCFAADNIESVIEPLRQRLHPFMPEKPTTNELIAYTKRIAAAEAIEIGSDAVVEQLVNAAYGVPRNILGGLELAFVDGRKLKTENIKHICKRLGMMIGVKAIKRG